MLEQDLLQSQVINSRKLESSKKEKSNSMHDIACERSCCDIEEKLQKVRNENDQLIASLRELIRRKKFACNEISRPHILSTI